MPARSLVLGGLLAVLLCRAGGGWAATAEEYALKAAFIYNFSLFGRWPEGPREGFRLCFYGRHPFGQVLPSLSGKEVNHQPLLLAFPKTLEEARACQILYYNPTAAPDGADLLEALRQSPVLTVSDHALAWSQGAMIVLAVEPNRVVFDVNLSRVREAGVYLSAQLLRLARIVRTD